MSKVDITKQRLSYHAYPETQWARDIFDLVLKHQWRVTEVNFTEDIKSWSSVLTPGQKKILSRILRGFTQTEFVIRDYWTQIVAKNFPLPEIVEMATAFAIQECIHAEAYQALPSTLGINDFEEFLADPAASERLNYLMEKKANPAESLAIFSGAIEGVSLFSAFAILLAYWKFLGVMKGVYYVTSWSASEEILHSNSAIKLFNTLVENNQCSFDSEVINNGFIEVVANEERYIRSIFDGVNEDFPLTPDQLIAYIRQVANKKLLHLGLTPLFTTDSKLADSVASWVDPILNTSRLSDFFAGRDGKSYQSKPSTDVENVDWSALL